MRRFPRPAHPPGRDPLSSFAFCSSLSLSVAVVDEARRHAVHRDVGSPPRPPATSTGRSPQALLPGGWSGPDCRSRPRSSGILTIRARRAFIIPARTRPGKTASLKVVRFTSSTAAQSASDIRMKSWSRVIPAFDQNIDRPSAPSSACDGNATPPRPRRVHRGRTVRVRHPPEAAWASSGATRVPDSATAAACAAAPRDRRPDRFRSPGHQGGPARPIKTSRPTPERMADRVPASRSPRQSNGPGNPSLAARIADPPAPKGKGRTPLADQRPNVVGTVDGAPPSPCRSGGSCPIKAFAG